MTDLQEGTEQTAELASAAEVISAPDPIATALQTIELLQGKRVALVDRIETNKRTSSGLAFDAFTGNGRARKSLDDLNTEALTLARELLSLDAAVAEGERRHAAACAAKAAEEERGRAQLARKRFTEFAQLAQEFSDRIDDVVRLYGEMREASAALHATGYGPAEAQITRWGQRTIVHRCQHDRNLRFEDMMADGRERQWLMRAPHDWHQKLLADTAAVFELPAQAAE
jgi:hypothetical protein